MEILTVSPSRFSTFDWIANTIPRPEIVFWTAAVAALRWHLPSVEFSHFWLVALVDEENNDNDRTSFILFVAILLCVGLMHKKMKQSITCIDRFVCIQFVFGDDNMVSCILLVLQPALIDNKICIVTLSFWVIIKPPCILTTAKPDVSMEPI